MSINYPYHYMSLQMKPKCLQRIPVNTSIKPVDSGSLVDLVRNRWIVHYKSIQCAHPKHHLEKLYTRMGAQLLTEVLIYAK